MRKLMLFICLFMIAICCQAQLFSYDYSKERVWLEPIFETYSLKGKRDGLLTILGGDQFRKKIDPIALKYLSQEVINYLFSKTGHMFIHFYISPTGDVLYVKFVIHKELFDLTLITEEQLKGMYDSYKRLKFEVRKFNPEEDFDFCMIMGRAYIPE